MHIVYLRKGSQVPGRGKWRFVLDHTGQRFPPDSRIRELARDTLGLGRQKTSNFIDTYYYDERTPVLILEIRSGIPRKRIDQLAEKLEAEAIIP